MLFVMLALKLLMPMLLGAILGLAFIWMALHGFWQSWQTRQWQTTTGKVITAQISEQRVRNRMVYQTKVTYRYAVQAQMYESQRIFIADRWSAEDRPTAEQRLRHYRIGSEVKVYYNPRHPKEAVLEVRNHPALYWLLGGGSLFLCFSLAIGALILPSAMETCGITITSTHSRPGAPAWCLTWVP